MTFHNADTFWLIGGWAVAGFVFLFRRPSGKLVALPLAIVGGLAIVASFGSFGLLRTLTGALLSALAMLAFAALISYFFKRVLKSNEGSIGDDVQSYK